MSRDPDHPFGTASGRPNVLLITTDEERYKLPKLAGFSLPARDWLHRRGTSFDNYYVASAMCSSSRSVMYTGQHVTKTKIYDNDNMPYIRPLDTQMATLGTMMQAAGYYTAYQGKWHLSNAYRTPENPDPTAKALQPYGFTEFNDWGDIDGGAWAGLKVDPVIAGQAVRWLRDKAATVARDQPWFMTVNFVNPHDIMSYDYGTTRTITPPPNLAEAVKVKPPAETPLYSKNWDIDVPASATDDLSGAPQAVREFAGLADAMFGQVEDPADFRKGLNFYVNCIRDVDRSVALVLDALVASGQADNTVVVFTSDHGELAGSHGLRQKGNLVYDENFHVPLIICHPDVDGGARSDVMGSAVDLAPTILHLAGVDPARAARPVRRAGRSLAGPRAGRQRHRPRRCADRGGIGADPGRRLLAGVRLRRRRAAGPIRRAAARLAQARVPARLHRPPVHLRPVLQPAGPQPARTPWTSCWPTTTSCSTTGWPTRRRPSTWPPTRSTASSSRPTWPSWKR